MQRATEVQGVSCGFMLGAECERLGNSESVGGVPLNNLRSAVPDWES